jgi:dolichol-phosphate mannosyltransferase
MKREMLSIVLPTYNERKNISILIPRIESFFKKKGFRFEIIVVDDSSPDGTFELSRKLNRKYGNIVTVVRKKKEGIGAALREGYDRARGDIIVSSDSDLSFEVADMLRLVEKIEEGYDLVVGSRHMNSSNYEKKKPGTKLKWFISFFGNKMVSAMSGVRIHDFSANFRAIRRRVWRSIETKEKTNSILMEMIVKTRYKGYKIAEIPVVFKDRLYGESKLQLGREAPKFFGKLVKIVFETRVLGK